MKLLLNRLHVVFLRAQSKALILFSLYTAPIASVVSRFDVNQQQYADDTQLYVFLSALNLDTSIAHLQSCISALGYWFLHNSLALNADKTEAVCIGVSARRKTLDQLDH